MYNTQCPYVAFYSKEEGLKAALFTMQEAIEGNEECEELLEILETLKVGDSVMFGGGAAPLITVTGVGEWSK